MSTGLLDREMRIARLGVAHIRYWGFWLISKGVMGIIYIGLVAEGARRLCPPLGQKLFKIFPAIGRWDWSHRIDAAICFAGVLFAGVFWAWTGLVKMWLGCFEKGAAHRVIIVLLGGTFIAVDCCMFYLSIANWNWGGAQFSLSALLSTVGWLAALIFVCVVTVNLKQEVQEAKQ